MRKNQQELKIAVEAAQAAITAPMLARIQIYKEVHDFFCSYLIGKYAENGFNKMAAAILTANFFKCSTSFDFGTDNFVTANEQALINELAIYDTFYDAIFTRYNNENTEVANAAILSEMITAGYCSFLVPTVTGAVPVSVSDTIYVLKNTTSTDDITANDDANGTIESIIIISEPTQGTVDDNGYYTPNTDYIGADTFQYALVNANGQGNTVTVTVNVVDSFDFAGTTIDLCQDEAHIISWTVNYPTIPAYITDLRVDVASLELRSFISTQPTPDTTHHGTTGVLPALNGGQRAYLASGQPNGFVLSISYKEAGVNKTGLLECDCPPFALSDNYCENEIAIIYTAS